MYDASKVYAFAAELAASGQVERPAVLALIRADVLAIKLAYAPVSDASARAVPVFATTFRKLVPARPASQSAAGVLA